MAVELTVVTPEGQAFSGPVESVRLPGSEGEFGVLTGHEVFMTALQAGMMIVHEAGGTVTDVDGKSLDFTHGRRLEHNRGVIATGGKIHDAVVAAVQSVLRK